MKKNVKHNWIKLAVISFIFVFIAIATIININKNTIENVNTNEETKKTVIGEGSGTYTVTFNHYKNGTTTVLRTATSTIVSWGTQITLSNYKENIPGYTYDHATRNGSSVTQIQIVSNTTINFYYNAQNNTVTFNHYKLGSSTALMSATTASIAYGTTITLANYKQTITGYTYSSAALSFATSSTITTHTITENVTINLYYTSNNYTVTFNYYDYDTKTQIKSPTSITVPYGTVVKQADYRDIIGYTYYGLLNSNLESISEEPDQKEGITENITYYFSYKKNNYTVTFNHYENGTSTKVYTTAHTASIAYNTSITLADYKKTITGFTYSKATLSTNTSSAITSHTVTANVTINMYYTRNNYTVTFNHYENGTSTKVFTSAHTASIAYNTSITLADYKKSITGYNYTKATLSTATGTAITSHTVTGNVTINMYYTKKSNLTYTINYRYLNGSNKVAIPGKTSVTGSNQTYGATLNLATYATAIPGYRYAYIHHDGTLLSGTTTTIKDTTNVIDICYDNIGKVAYTVNYLEYGTNAVVHPADSSPNGDYGTTINSKNDCYIDLSENGYYFCSIQSQNQYKIENQSQIKYKAEIKNQSKIKNKEVEI